VSLDNTTYEMIGTIYGSARYGTLVSAIDADDTSMQVQLNTSSQIFGGTLEDAEVDATLCKVGDEYINYIDATLDGSGRYTLSGMLRGRFDDASSHNAVNHLFVLIVPFLNMTSIKYDRQTDLSEVHKLQWIEQKKKLWMK
jgi:hypothetical protein